MSIAVTGAAGQLGAELCRQLGPQAVALDHAALDIADAEAVHYVLRKIRPTAVFNPAAYTKVDLAEDERERAAAINVRAVQNLADVCRAIDCPLVHFSTDYVFSAAADNPRPWREDDPVAAQGVYAQTKLAGEACARSWEKHFVVRTCGLYGHPDKWHAGPNFVDTMLRLGRERPKLRVVFDQQCTPSFTRDVATAALFLSQTQAYGTYHVTNTGGVAWCDFAREIFRLAGLSVAVEPITAAQYGAKAPRPTYSVLETSKYAALGGPALRSWQAALADYLQRAAP